MKKVIFSLAFALIASVSFANTSTAPVDCSAPVESASEQMITYEIDHPIMGKVLVSNVLFDENTMICGFSLSYNSGTGTSWSVWYDCSSMTMGDIMNFVMNFFF
jgi:hypothetical protein